MNALSVTTIGVCIASLQGLSCRCLEIERTSHKGAPADDDLLEQVTLTLGNVRAIGRNGRGKPWPDFRCRAMAVGAERAIAREPDVTTIRHQLQTLASTILDDIATFNFLWVQKDRSACVNADALFGDKVKAAFPSASEDIMEAGNCFAAECNTAAVFHLMRVAEIGLRALARDRRITTPKKQPLELATWEEIIKQLEDAEKAIQGYPKTLAREAQYDFYHGALMQFRAFKNAFRNQIMHTRKSYDRLRAESVFNHVREFMQILATQISENTRTPKIWKGKKWVTAS